MKHIKLFEEYSDHVDNDVLLDFINETSDVKTYLHTTKEEEICKKIMESGYQFSSFYKTTDEIINDMASLDYKMLLREDYGIYTVIIQVNKNIPGYYNDLTIKEPFEDEEGDLIPNIYYVSGMHLVNRIGYLITKEPLEYEFECRID